MNDKALSLSDEWQPFRDLIASKSKIQLLEMVARDSELHEMITFLTLKSSYAVQELSVCLSQDPFVVTTWIKEILIQNEVKGSFYFYFQTSSILETPPPWIKVDLGEDYHWVYPLWEMDQLSRAFSFIPLDCSYLLEFIAYEGRYRAYLSYYRHILIRKKELAELKQHDYGAFSKAIDFFDPRDYD